ncbi:DUF2313 domain-containing protein [Methylobacterium sp. J-030]|uniref:YmfQ family protein n=1 Tax=Methylobacterium sp. J-030 TaxID=2836627 RepID=UPI001FBB47CE|nr:putative phage tail protein [Methylobacterium sp. J-030]MCJ2067743.1 DUF2313 domain-containing protein [Methylobacterium sp. J-030]
MADAILGHSGDDYAEGLGNLLPTGAAWDRDPNGALGLLISALGQVWGDVDTQALGLLQIETDPRFTLQLLGDWERAFGLPDPCIPVVQTLPERRAALVQKMTLHGGQSRAFFIGIAAALGYAITITEYVPFQFGLSSFGGSHGRFNPPNFRFVWSVSISGQRLTRFQFGASSFGRDPFLDIRRAEDLECILQRLKPAHSMLFFSYGAAAPTIIQQRFSFGASEFGRDPLLRLIDA